jgi:hypothetical protein
MIGLISFNSFILITMKVLVACEESQVVCSAFRAKGHEAYSCDIVECSGGHPEWHIQDDVLNHLSDDWDLMVGHPMCTYLANSGVCWLYNKDGTINKERWEKMELAAEFFLKLYNAPISKIALENPVMHKHAKKIIGIEQSQTIQPWMFNHTEQKATCLWLKGLPKLYPSSTSLECQNNLTYAKMMKLPKRERERLHYLSPSPTRQKERSKTFSGIAAAMADQWG